MQEYVVFGEDLTAELWTFKPGAVEILDEYFPEWRDHDLFTIHRAKHFVEERFLIDAPMPREIMKEVLSIIKANLAKEIVEKSEPLITREKVMK